MKHVYFLIVVLFFSCQNQVDDAINELKISKSNEIVKSEIDLFYDEHSTNQDESVSIGSVSNGALKNGVLMPFEGSNFRYFDTLSYLSERGFTNDKVKETVIISYSTLESNNRFYQIMECSSKCGGELPPHRTHQNGLNVDFMMPLKKNNSPYYGLDDLGADHYWLTFDNNGRYSEDETISIDFESVAEHILELNSQAIKFGLKISKVIIKIELKDDLFNSEIGEKLKRSGIYVVKNLTPLINDLHDEHYHIDFELI